MTCSYDVGSVKLPREKVADVKALIEKFGLGDLFEVQSLGRPLLKQVEVGMSHGTVGAVDDMLKEVAKLLAGTSEDGQIVEYDYDAESRGYFVFVAGFLHEVPYSPIVVDVPPIDGPGTIVMRHVMLQVVILPGKKGVIIGKAE